MSTAGRPSCSTHVVFAEPDHAEATELQADVFEQLGYQAENSTWRNFYLMGAQELRGGIRPVPASGGQRRDCSAPLTIEQVFDAIGGTARTGPAPPAPTSSSTGRSPISTSAGSPGSSNGSLRRRGGAPRRRRHLHLSMARSVFDGLVLRTIDAAEAFGDGRVIADGDVGARCSSCSACSTTWTRTSPSSRPDSDQRPSRNLRRGEAEPRSRVPGATGPVCARHQVDVGHRLPGRQSSRSTILDVPAGRPMSHRNRSAATPARSMSPIRPGGRRDGNRAVSPGRKASTNAGRQVAGRRLGPRPRSTRGGPRPRASGPSTVAQAGRSPAPGTGGAAPGLVRHGGRPPPGSARAHRPGRWRSRPSGRPAPGLDVGAALRIAARVLVEDLAAGRAFAASPSGCRRCGPGG